MIIVVFFIFLEIRRQQKKDKKEEEKKKKEEEEAKKLEELGAGFEPATAAYKQQLTVPCGVKITYHGHGTEGCKFPFTYHDETYNACTTVGDNGEGTTDYSWCATVVDGEGKYISGKNNWKKCEGDPKTSDYLSGNVRYNFTTYNNVIKKLEIQGHEYCSVVIYDENDFQGVGLLLENSIKNTWEHNDIKSVYRDIDDDFRVSSLEIFDGSQPIVLSEDQNLKLAPTGPVNYNKSIHHFTTEISYHNTLRDIDVVNL